MASSDLRRIVILLSGPVGAGKTTLAKALVGRFRFERLFTRDSILRRLPETPRTRVDLQAAGERLDQQTSGQWVADELVELMARDLSAPGFVVDAVLIAEQVEAVRRARQGPVVHVHLTAPLAELEARYANKRSGLEESDNYPVVLRNATEASVDQLGKDADLVFDTAKTSLEAEVDAVAKKLGQET
jgi:adenylosuccinate synthase